MLFEKKELLESAQEIREQLFTELPFYHRENSHIHSFLEHKNREQFSDIVNKYIVQFPKNTIAYRELTLLQRILKIDINGERTPLLAGIYDLTYHIEDEANIAPTVENGLLPVLIGEGWMEFINRNCKAGVILLGSSTVGSMRAAEKIGAGLEDPQVVTVVDFDEQALEMLQANKKAGTIVRKADLTNAADFIGEYGLAISDFVHSFIPRKKWAESFKNIGNHIVTDGYYVGAVYLYDSAYENVELSHMSSRARGQGVIEYLNSLGMHSVVSELIGDLDTYRLMKVFPSDRARTNNFQGEDELRSFLKDAGFNLTHFKISDLPHIQGTGLRRLVFVSKRE